MYILVGGQHHREGNGWHQARHQVTRRYAIQISMQKSIAGFGKKEKKQLLPQKERTKKKRNKHMLLRGEYEIYIFALVFSIRGKSLFSPLYHIGVWGGGGKGKKDVSGR